MTMFLPESISTSQGDSDLRSLSSCEMETFKNLCNHLNLSQSSKKVQIVYRGESKENLSNKLNEQYGTQKFFEYLFVIGEKAKYFWSQTRTSLENLNYLKSIEDTDNETFKFIFNEFNSILVRGNSNIFENRARRLDEFKETQPDFISFFSNVRNLKKFLKKTNGVDNKIQLRDYYLYLLHTFNLDKISFFVSTSFKRKVARRFAHERFAPSKKGIIFYYFLPEPIYRYGVSSSSLQVGQSLWTSQGLPIYTQNFYPKQYEVAVKGALFPHFILGLFDLESDSFVVNPHVFKQEDQHVPLIPQQGFFIDQENFDDTIKETGYSGSVKRAGITGAYSDDFHR